MEPNKDKDLSRIDQLFNSQSQLHEIWLKNERLYRAKHSKKQLNKLIKAGRSNLFIPAIRNTVNIINSIFSTAFFSAGCPIELVPIGEDENDLLTDRNKTIKYYFEKKYKPVRNLKRAFLSALLYKMGVVSTYWDGRRNKVITQFIPVTDIAFDDECVDIDDIQEIAYKYNESNREIRQKVESKYYNLKGLKKKLFNDGSQDNTRREVKVIYIKDFKEGGYLSKSFIDGILVREKKFKQNPFQYGYALDRLPSIDESERGDDILCYGGDIVENLEDLQRELNEKRNLKNDILEEQLNPSTYVGIDAKVNPKDMKRGPGKRIKVDGDVKQIKDRPVPSTYELTQDLAMLGTDFKASAGVNSLHDGDTNPSDRRSAVALATISSNSSTRIEDMITLIKETLFEHWAKAWTKLVFDNADDAVINKVTGKENPFGTKGRRDEIEYDLRINFGMTIDKEKKINDLIGLLQMVAQNPNINPAIVEKMLKKILDMRIGEDTDLSEMFNSAKNEGEEEQELSKDDIEKEKIKNNIL